VRQRHESSLPLKGEGSGRRSFDLPLLLVLGFALRAGMALLYPSIDHPDQIYQSVEQAHRLLFGYGVVPWEFRAGARSWLMPGVAAAFMGPASWLSERPEFYLGAVAFGLCALSLLQIWAAYEIGRPLGRMHALLAGFGAAIWFDLVYYAAQPLSETLATSALLAALALLTRPAPGRRALLAGGLALGLAFILRYHLAPALLLIAWMGGGRDSRRWWALAAGAALPVLLLGLTDWLSWGVPFASLINNLRFNLIDGGSQIYGTAPPLWYLAAIITRWGFFAGVALIALAVGTARKPTLFLVTAAILLSYSLIPHKEYRFILPGLASLVVLTGIGLGELIQDIARLLPRAKPLLLPAMLLVWLTGTAGAALSEEGQKRLFAGRNALDAFAALHVDKGLCGLALDEPWWRAPGYSALHRDIPIYLWETVAPQPEAVNVILRPRDKPPEPGFTRAKCFAKGPALCIDRRPGPCRPAPGLTLDEELIHRGQ
jgi:GPI mannosyltransferase 3